MVTLLVALWLWVFHAPVIAVRSTSARVLLAMGATLSLAACSPRPASLTAPSVGPGSIAAIPPPATPSSAPAIFPSGPAVLQVWGYTLFSSFSPVCAPLFGTLDGTSVATPVAVEAMAVPSAQLGGASWLVRSDPAFGSIDFQIQMRGTTSVYGVEVTGTINGAARDAELVAGSVARNLVVNLPASSPPLLVDGHASTATPHIEGTITGAVHFSDTRGGRTDCPMVFWMLTSRSSS